MPHHHHYSTQYSTLHKMLGKKCFCTSKVTSTDSVKILSKYVCSFLWSFILIVFNKDDFIGFVPSNECNVTVKYLTMMVSYYTISRKMNLYQCLKSFRLIFWKFYSYPIDLIQNVIEFILPYLNYINECYFYHFLWMIWKH